MVDFDRSGSLPKVVMTNEEQEFFRNRVNEPGFHRKIGNMRMVLGLLSEPNSGINDLMAVAEFQRKDLPNIGSGALFYGFEAGVKVRDYSRENGGPLVVTALINNTLESESRAEDHFEGDE